MLSLFKTTGLTSIMSGIALLAFAGAVDAQTPEEKGLEIAVRSDRTDHGFTDSTVDLEMILKNKAGKQSARKLYIQTFEINNEALGDRSLIVFNSPADIKGTALLSHAHILDADDQWLYLPALKRVKRISSVNKSGPFVGSEFAFEDFTALELNKYTYKYVRAEEYGGLMCDVIERYPRYEHSGYTRQVSWIDQKDYQVRKVVFYNRRDALLKTLTLEDYRKYNDAYWRSHLFRMVNHQNGKSTELKYSNYQFETGLGEQDFEKGKLSRIR